MGHRYNLNTINLLKKELMKPKFPKVSLETSYETSIKPFLLEQKVIKRVNKYIKDNELPENLDIYGKELVQEAMKSKIIDSPEIFLVRYNNLSDTKMFSELAQGIQGKYL